jgi:hypothetical protein
MWNQQDPRLVSSHKDNIKQSLVWPTYDYTHVSSPATRSDETMAGESEECPPCESVQTFGIPEVHGVTKSGHGLIYTHKLPHNNEGYLLVPMTGDGWLFAPSPKPISLVTPRGIVPREKLQQLVKQRPDYAAFLDGGCPLACVMW